ncbi:hypothetical protein PPACK8108_LOCUS3639 [Phakopsora pachyrhizi]|uniref:Uncharacterized protein n=1 Tax=Phakopsora pachyrhizi TaxID=170000 RepID=A0AAV0AM14_PHAPC|nr:hypothetical protein PPACK8108_LOCUS3639 [Phakopsora pachyrhizi]
MAYRFLGIPLLGRAQYPPIQSCKKVRLCRRWIFRSPSTFSSDSLAPLQPPQQAPSKKRLVFPLILITILTTVSINFRRLQLESEEKVRRLNAQISILKRLLADPSVRDEEWLKYAERQLSLVDLHIGPVKPHQRSNITEKVTWKQALLGKKDLNQFHS